jgi:tRNA A37 N6-isopentenylltransferase MiaA
MIDQQNGLDEIVSVFDSQLSVAEGGDLDFEKGILQAIGYKEFYPLYLEIKSGETKDFEKGLAEAKLRLRQKTMDYTKYQIKWL